MRTATPISISGEARGQLVKYWRGRSVSKRLVERARIVLMAADGEQNQVIAATRSGYLALIKRGPGDELHCSYDGGLNWDAGTMIDYKGLFNGTAIEVEPDVMLVAYPQSMDEIRPAYTRVQRIPITPDGPVPE